ncbi:MAG: hypothetical protein IKD44_05930 [Lentisphaeria bacterium]|nr:hypothetical protein [Lentisphaeria bacterium]
MKMTILFMLLAGAMLGAAENIVIYKPTLQLIGKRVVPRRHSEAGSGVVRVEKIPELGYRFVFAIQNTSGNIVKLATGFNHVRFDAEPGKNQFVLHLSHRIMSVKTECGKAFPLVQPLESFRIVKLRPGEGTLLNVTCWIPESKLRAGDKLVIEYAPQNFGRYDFMHLKVRSKAVDFKFPGTAKKVEPVVI